MKEANLDIDINKAIHNVDLHITLIGINEFRFRVRLALFFFRLGTWIMGAKFVLNSEESNETSSSVLEEG